tara:strand:+ start:561 stop:1148 length:588 start_codon:yes stop_codon:yes gene_type:complete
MVLNNLNSVIAKMPPLAASTHIWLLDFLIGTTIFNFLLLVECAQHSAAAEYKTRATPRMTDRPPTCAPLDLPSCWHRYAVVNFMMTEGGALAKKEAAAAAAAAATTFKPIVGVLTSATTDTEAGARPEDVTINTRSRRPSISGAAERGKAAKHKVARNVSDVTCRLAFPVLYALFVAGMLGSLEAYGHASECDWD